MASDAPSATGSRKRKASPTERDPLSGVIRWEVDKDSISDDYVYSPAIEVGGIPWQISTRREEENEHLRVYLYPMDGDFKFISVDAKFTFQMINHDNPSRTKRYEGTVKYDDDKQQWGYRKFIKWESAIDEDEGFIKDNKLTLQVAFSLSNLIGFSKPNRFDFSNPNEPHHDLALIIGGERIYVSKQYLSIHSPVFRAMFYGEFVEKDKKEIELTEVNGKEFVELLHVIYPPYKKITDDTFEFLLKLSDRFDINVIVNQCEQHLISSIKCTVAEKLMFAGKYNLIELKEHCLKQLTSTKEVKNLQNTKSYTDFTNEIRLALFDKMMSLPD